MDVQFKNAVGAFFSEFSKFQTHSIGMALRALSRDPVFVEHAEKLLDLEARLNLIQRMAFARDLPATLIAELEACILRARKLRDQHADFERHLPHAAAARRRPATRRNADFARLLELENLGIPAVERVLDYTQEAVQLQEALRVVTEKLEFEVAILQQRGPPLTA